LVKRKIIRGWHFSQTIIGSVGLSPVNYRKTKGDIMTQTQFSHSTSISFVLFLALFTLSENASALDAANDALCSTSEIRGEISKQHVNLLDENTRSGLMQTPNVAGALPAVKSLRTNENIARQQIDVSGLQNRAAMSRSLNTGGAASRLPNIASAVVRSPNLQSARQN
jgi:hypothetical protein